MRSSNCWRSGHCFCNESIVVQAPPYTMLSIVFTCASSCSRIWPQTRLRKYSICLSRCLSKRCADEPPCRCRPWTSPVPTLLLTRFSPSQTPMAYEPNRMRTRAIRRSVLSNKLSGSVAKPATGGLDGSGKGGKTTYLASGLQKTAAPVLELVITPVSSCKTSDSTSVSFRENSSSVLGILEDKYREWASSIGFCSSSEKNSSVLARFKTRLFDVKVTDCTPL